MSRHRGEPKRRLKPRYLRMAAAGSALVITLVAVLAGVGLIPVQKRPPAYADAAKLSPKVSAKVSAEVPLEVSSDQAPAAQPTVVVRPGDRLPAGSGTGRRVVFDQSAQRVWIVGASGVIERSYLVSGSLTDNLSPGTYAVYSRSRWAVGVDDSGVMQYFVRFTRGDNAAIGFHSIPTSHGVPLQTAAELGQPRSHGCIRQRLSDARAMWAFAHDGTKVVVTA